jgi:hypothetical protein
MSTVSSFVFFARERSKPNLPRVAEGGEDKEVVLASPTPFGAKQTGVLEDRQMPRKSLPGDARLLQGEEPDVEFEQRLSVALGKLIEQAAPRGVRQRVKQQVKVHSRCLGRRVLSCNNFVA